jgi:hypothetical protein
MTEPQAKDFTTLSPDSYKNGGAGFGWLMLLYQQLATCNYHGSNCGTDKEGLRRFERSVKMLEAMLISKLNETYKERIEKAIVKGSDALKQNDYNTFYESLRLRYMYLMQVLSNIPNFMPEEKAIEEITFDGTDEPNEVEPID